MTQDFARDMQLLKDLLQLAADRGHSGTDAYKHLDEFHRKVETDAGELMVSVQNLKKAFNETNRELLMGFWIAIFVDPVDPPHAQPQDIEPALTEAQLLARAHDTGGKLIALLDSLKDPHKRMTDPAPPQGEVLKNRINDIRTLVPGDLSTGYLWLNRRLDSMIRAFTKDGGGGGQDTYWPSNYVSSSSSSSSSSTYP
ncbi:MAG TPA: hypothetical protein VG796_30110 [Verrucomicrobiales bacterium]|jgi:hypothetical protein|nr:hypothetical protein [Verrucomicrobiales bacterium]